MAETVIAVCEIAGPAAAIVIGGILLGIAIGKIRV